jgi:hypothetical protein
VARDYKTEYRDRIERKLKAGFTRSQARGHPRPGEGYVSARGPPLSDAKLDAALKRLRRPNATLSGVAAETKVSRERLSRYAKDVAGARREGLKWVFDDRRIRRVKVITTQQYAPVKLRVRGFEPVHIAGLHFREAGQALRDQRRVPEFVRRWEGTRIKDVRGRWHTLSTDLNQIYSAVHMHDYSFEQFYRIEV